LDDLCPPRRPRKTSVAPESREVNSLERTAGSYLQAYEAERDARREERRKRRAESEERRRAEPTLDVVLFTPSPPSSSKRRKRRQVDASEQGLKREQSRTVGKELFSLLEAKGGESGATLTVAEREEKEQFVAVEEILAQMDADKDG